MNTTRIADLPENTINISEGPNNTYMPMNVHPNPYGNSNTPSILPHPSTTQPPQTVPQMQPQMAPQVPAQIASQPQFKLPTRDIPIDTGSYMQDEEIQANYIPKHNVSSDYVRDYEKINNEKIEKYEKDRRRKSHWEMIFDEIQTPILVAVLFFFFQIPFVNTMIFRNFEFLGLFSADGNMNTNGYIFKSVAFAVSYYIMLATVNYIAE